MVSLKINFWKLKSGNNAEEGRFAEERRGCVVASLYVTTIINHQCFRGVSRSSYTGSNSNAIFVCLSDGRSVRALPPSASHVLLQTRDMMVSTTRAVPAIKAKA